MYIEGKEKNFERSAVAAGELSGTLQVLVRPVDSVTRPAVCYYYLFIKSSDVILYVLNSNMIYFIRR